MPDIASNAFDGIPAEKVMIFDSYSSNQFGKLPVSKGLIIEGCLPWPTPIYRVRYIYRIRHIYRV